MRESRKALGAESGQESRKDFFARKELRVLRRVNRSQPVGGAVRSLARKLFRKRGLSASVLEQHWAEIVGEEISERSRPEKISRHGGVSVLTIYSDGGSALEVQHMAPRILENLERFYGDAAPKRLRVVQRPFRKRAALSSKAKKP